MIFIKNKEVYPLFIGDLMLEHEEYKIGDPLPSGWELVSESEIPTIGEYEELKEEFPEKINGTWFQKFIVTPMPQQKIDLINLQKEAIDGLGETKTFEEIRHLFI